MGLVLVLAAIAVIVVGMWKLPALFVDESSLRDPDGKRDRVAIQQAYNAARVPIGVVCAAVLAALAATAGVLTTRRAIAVTQAGVDVTRQSLADAETRHRLDRADAMAKDDRDRQQWREEQLSQRFQDASAQLGDTKAAVRLAGVYALARLADDWAEQRQVCLDVLCSYLRIADRHDERGEDQVLFAVQAVLKRGLEVGETGATWPDMRVDLSRTVLRDFQLTRFAVHSLSLSGATLVGDCALDGEVSDASDLNGMHVKGSLQLAGVGLLGVNMRNINYEGNLRNSEWKFQPRPFGSGVSLLKYKTHDMSDFTMSSGNLLLTVGAYRGFRLPVRLDLRNALVAADTVLHVAAGATFGQTGDLDATVLTHNAKIQGDLKVRGGVKQEPSR